MRTKEQAAATRAKLRAQLAAADLSEPMRRAMLTAQGTVLDQPEWDTPADYCTGHESLRGDLMGASFYCEGSTVCHQAMEAYKADREPDPDVLHIEVDERVKVATVVALMKRGLCLDGRAGNDHKLTVLGRNVYDVLKARRGSGS